MQIKTHISCVKGLSGKTLCNNCREGKNIRSSLDKLLNGGLQIPDTIYERWRGDQEHQPFTLLITGAPGTGKTTFALELAYRWTDKKHYTERDKNGIPLYTLYFSSESSGETLRESKVKAFGWNTNKFNVLGDESAQKGLQEGWVGICGTDQLADLNTSNVKKFLQSLIKVWRVWLNRVIKPSEKDTLMVHPRRPAMVVIDSLNILDNKDIQGKALTQLISEFKDGPLILAVILDSSATERHFWEYTADIILKLERIDLHTGLNQVAYNIGTFEIQKARWQKHSFGLHQMKILSKPNEKSRHNPSDKLDKSPNQSYPAYFEDGGICIYQSVHRQLSRKTSRYGTKAELEWESSTLDDLDKLIGVGIKEEGGFPKARCTAMVGVRGAMKSHLAYSWLLKNAADKKKQPDDRLSLLVSLRDDESAAKSRLIKIANYEGVQFEDAAEFLRIVYYRPGYITPDEFLFRLWFHLDDFKPRHVVVNALEQLDVMFPLCAAQPSFVASAIDMLCDQNRTSIVIAVIPQGVPSGETYGLLPLSDLVLRFERKLLPYTLLSKHYKRKYQTEEYKQLPSKVNETVVEVIRVPSGKPCGGTGLLDLDPDNNRLRFLVLPHGVNKHVEESGSVRQDLTE